MLRVGITLEIERVDGEPMHVYTVAQAVHDAVVGMGLYVDSSYYEVNSAEIAGVDDEE